MKRIRNTYTEQSYKRQRRHIPNQSVQIYLQDPLARKTINTLFQFGHHDALDAIRKAIPVSDNNAP